MPRPPWQPSQGLWRMGVSLLVIKWWKCRSINAVIFMVCLWVSLVTVVNFTTNGDGYSSWTLKDKTIQSRQMTFSDTADLSFGYRTKSDPGQMATNLHVPAHLIVLTRGQRGQTDNSIENGIISGRRMQEIKAVEIEGSETASRVQDHGDRGNILISAGWDRIDRKAITAGEIRPDLQTPEKNPNDLLPNWTLEPESRRTTSSLSNVLKSGRSGSREQSRLDRVISSLAKGSLSEPDSRDHKTRFRVSERRDMAREMGRHEQSDITTQTDIIEQTDISRQRDGGLARGLDKGVNPASSHLPESIDSTRNRHSNFDDRASNSRGEIKIDTLLNGSKMYTTREIEVSTYSYGSRTLDNAGTHLASPPASEADSVQSIHNFKTEYRKSNREVPVAMQMLVPYRNNDSSPLYKIVDTKSQSSTTQINSRPKHQTLFHDLFTSTAKSRGPVSSSLGREKSNSNPPHADNMQNANILSQNVTRQIRLSTQPETDQLSSAHTFSTNINSYFMTYSLVDLSGHKPRDARATHHEESPQESLLNDGFDLYSYNVTSSNLISLDRSLPDTRPEGCIMPANTMTLPKASVIICFHNEALSVLLRTIHSILDRSPPGLLEKIILVDDNSSLYDLQEVLEENLTHLSDKIVLIRTMKREGLVRARLLGCDVATSDVIIFLDAHCECNVGWLEPLLHSLKLDPHKVVSPYIDTIKAENFEYRRSPARLKGGFNWRLEFGWRAANVAGNLGSEKDSIITPVISGGLFAIRRDYFKFIGSYDPELDIWGGENFELSFKTWMCGGSLEIIPCSRVGHVFRSSLPYSFLRETEEVVLRNLGRVASVWMDDYAEVFYSAVNMPKDVDLGNLAQRIQLRKNLKCHSFQWYLSNVFPQLEILEQDTLNYGMVRNKGSLMCLDVLNSATEFFLGLSPCHGGKNQTFRLTSANKLNQAGACIKPGINKQLVLSVCKQNMSWIYQDGFLKLEPTDLCLTSVDNEVVHLLPCDFGFETNVVVSKHKQSSSSLNKHHGIDNSLINVNSFQKWTFDYSFNWKRRRRRV